MTELQAKAAKIATGVVPLTLVGVLAAAALGVNAATLRGERPLFKLSARPRWHAVFPGTAARYRITIHRRHGFDGRVILWVGGLPPGTGARIVRPNHVLAKLTVFTLRGVPPGSYSLRVHGLSRHRRREETIRLRLTILRRRSAPFTLWGNAHAPLYPGVAERMNIAVQNPNRRAILVWGLAMRVRRIEAPRATPTHPCTRADFALKQYSGFYPLFVPRRATRTLKELSIARKWWPGIAMLNRPLDQDGCEGATIKLSYSGTARTR